MANGEPVTNKAPQNTEKNKPKMQLPVNTDTKDNTEVFREQREKSPTSVKDVKDIILSSSKNIIGKVLSPSKDKLGQTAKKQEVKKQPLMTRRELCDPFGSDEEEEEESKDVKTPEVNGESDKSNEPDNKMPELPKPNPVSRFSLL